MGFSSDRPAAGSKQAARRRDPSRRDLLGLGSAALATAALPRAATAQSIFLPDIRSEFTWLPTLPIGRPQAVPTDEGMLFFVQHAIDANAIVYAARRLPDGRLDPDEPVETFWRRFATAGHRRELSFFERHFAFGLVATPEKEGVWSVHIAALSSRKGRLDLGPDGKPRILVDIDGKPRRPVYAWVEAERGHFIPTIRHVDVYAVTEGEKGFYRERLVFG